MNDFTVYRRFMGLAFKKCLSINLMRKCPATSQVIPTSNPKSNCVKKLLTSLPLFFGLAASPRPDIKSLSGSVS